MSAYVILEGDVREGTSRRAADAGQELRAFGGEILASGPWELLVGEPAFSSGMIIRFPDKQAAYAWYYAQGYRMFLDVDTVALDCRLRLICGATIWAGKSSTTNATSFGLCAGICTTSLKYARHFQRNADAGMVMVNLPTAGVDYHVPFGGRKTRATARRNKARAPLNSSPSARPRI